MKTLAKFILALAPLIAMGISLALPAIAMADGPVTATRLLLAAPESVPIGQPAHMTAVLRDDSDQPIADAMIRFYIPVTFMTGSGLELLDQVSTNAQGVASLEYAPRQADSMHLVAQFEGDAEHAPSQADLVVPVLGNHQLYQAQAGIQVPGLSKWVLVGVLSFVWGTYFLVVNLVLRIATARD